MTTPERNRALYGTAIPNVKDKKRVEEFMKAKDQAYMQGADAGAGAVKDGLNELGQPVSTAGMPENEAFFAIGRARDKQQLEGYKSFGDKSRAEAINAVRALTGKAPIANTPQEFNKLVDTSVAFGEKSALLTPEGRNRAMQQGVKAGLSYEEADAAVQGAFGFLSKKYGKGGAAPAGGVVAAPEQYGPSKALAGGAAPTTPLTPTQLSKPAIEVAATPVEKGPVEKFFGAAVPTVRTAGLLAPVGAAPAALAARSTQKAATLATETAKFGTPSQFAAQGAAAQKELAAAQKGLAATSRLGGGKTPITGSPYEKALEKWTQKTAEATGKVSAAEEGVKTAAKLEGAVAKAEAGAARAAKFAEFMKPVAGVSRTIGKVATPLAVGAELYDTGRFIASPEQREQMTREVEATAEKGALRSAVGGALSPMKTILGTGALVGETLQSGRRARESAAALSTAEKRSQAMTEERRKDYTDEQFKALSQEERSGYLKNLRERVKVK